MKSHRIIAALALCGAAFAAPACSTIDRLIGGGTVIENASPAEQPALRVIAAALTVKGAYQVIGDQFDAGLLTIEEAQEAKAAVDKAAAAVALAGRALEAGDAGGQLALLDAALRELLALPIFKQGVSP